MDEVLVSFMPSPATYTREDLVEINCHSGVVIIKSILRVFLAMGLRLADPGEFTKRAYLNGRIDLSQAEAVIGLVRARSEEALKASLRTLLGGLAGTVKAVRENIVAIRAPIEAAIDYPEEFNEQVPDRTAVTRELIAIKETLAGLIKGINRSRAYHEGVPVAIIGKPNVGKSSLLNRLLGQQRAIVHETPGTTRDLLDGFTNLGGYPLQLIDTAGIQGSDDPVEQVGIELALLAAAEAKLILFVIDGSVDYDRELLNSSTLLQHGQRLVIVVNKSDLPRKIDLELLQEEQPSIKVVLLSALTGDGMTELENGVASELDLLFGAGQETPLLISIRQESVISDVIQNVDEALKVLGNEPVEIFSLILQGAWIRLGEITGETANDDLLDRVFSEFCLGK